MKRRLQQQQQKQQQQQQQCGLVWRYSNLNLDLLQLQLLDDVYKNKSWLSRQAVYNIFSNLAIFISPPQWRIFYFLSSYYITDMHGRVQSSMLKCHENIKVSDER